MANSIRASVAPNIGRFDIHPPVVHSYRRSLHPRQRYPHFFGSAIWSSSNCALTDIGRGRLDGLIPTATVGTILVGHDCNAPLCGPLPNFKKQQNAVQMPRKRRGRCISFLASPHNRCVLHGELLFFASADLLVPPKIRGREREGQA